VEAIPSIMEAASVWPGKKTLLGLRQPYMLPAGFIGGFAGHPAGGAAWEKWPMAGWRGGAFFSVKMPKYGGVKKLVRRAALKLGEAAKDVIFGKCCRRHGC